MKSDGIMNRITSSFHDISTSLISKPVVIGRKKVDNYLLWIPHQSPVTTEDLKYTRNRWKTKGHLIDTSYAGMKER